MEKNVIMCVLLLLCFSSVVVRAALFVLDVDISRQHICFIVVESIGDEASALCFGKGQGGKLGNGNENDVLAEDARVSSFPVEDGGVKQIETGYFHSCALMESGRAFCWGEAAYVGFITALQNVLLPSFVAENVMQICVGEEHSCFLFTNGTVKCFGSGNF